MFCVCAGVVHINDILFLNGHKPLLGNHFKETHQKTKNLYQKLVEVIGLINR